MNVDFCTIIVQKFSYVRENTVCSLFYLWYDKSVMFYLWNISDEMPLIKGRDITFIVRRNYSEKKRKIYCTYRISDFSVCFIRM